MIPRPYLLFLGDIAAEPLAKTAFGVRDWLPGEAIGQSRLIGCTIDLGLPDLTPAQAAARGAQSMLIGGAPVGGAMPASWIPSLIEGLEAGLDLVSGLHTRLRDIVKIRQAAQRLGRALHDVRHTDRAIPIATGRKRSGKRLLTVGTDCAVGKKYTALAIAKALQNRGIDADFRATGQTGILIAGEGMAIDAVVADFVSGAAESLSPDNTENHWDIIEGQGALFHPAYAGVTLGLIHGSQPDALVLCHDPLRVSLHSFPGFLVPRLPVAMERYRDAARLTNPHADIAGISLDTSKFGEEAAHQLMRSLEKEHGLPCFDPLRFSLDPLVDRLLSL